MSGNGFSEQLERSVADFWGGILLVQLVHLLELLQGERQEPSEELLLMINRALIAHVLFWRRSLIFLGLSVCLISRSILMELLFGYEGRNIMSQIIPLLFIHI